MSKEVLAAERARWLAELSCALREARLLAKDLGASEGRIEAVELCARIDALRREVESLRLKGVARSCAEIDPEWMKSPWPCQPTDAAR